MDNFPDHVRDFSLSSHGSSSQRTSPAKITHRKPLFCQEQNVSCETIARRVAGSGDHVQGTRENGNFSKNLNLAAAPAIRYLGQRRVLGVQLFSPNDRQGVPLQASSVSDCEENHEDRIFQTYPAYGSGCTDRCLDAAGYKFELLPCFDIILRPESIDHSVAIKKKRIETIRSHHKRTALDMLCTKIGIGLCIILRNTDVNKITVVRATDHAQARHLPLQNIGFE